MMEYKCPRCGGPVTRNANSAAGAVGGLVGALLAQAFGGFSCAKCGPIPKSEFTPDERSSMTTGSVLMVVGALVLLAVVIAVIVSFSN
jgi:DNA-directed RNA polymerase subunit RPC12/RpoP